MSIIGQHIHIYEYPSDNIENPTVSILWEFINSDAEVDYYLEGLQSNYSGTYTKDQAYSVTLTNQRDYVFHIKTKVGHETEELIVPFSYQTESPKYVSPPVVFPYQEEAPTLITAPISQIRPAKFRGPAGSEEHNQSAKEFYYDIMTLFSGGRTMQKRIEDVQEIASNTIRALSHRIEALTAKIDHLETVADKQIHHQHTIRARDMHPGYPLMLKEDKSDVLGAFVDTEYDLVTPPLTSLPSSKTYLYDPINKITLSPEELNIEVTGSNGQIYENARGYAFDGHRSTCWIRKVKYPSNSSVSEEEVTVTVEIPKNISANSLINTISLTPYPEGGVDIVGLEIIDNNGNSSLAPGFPSRFNPISKAHEAIPIEDASRVRFCFSDRAAHSIRVTLRQRRYETDAGQKVFSMGIHDLGVFYADYNFSPSAFWAPIVLHPSTAPFSITSITPHFISFDSTDKNFREWFTYDIYQKEFDDSLTLLTSLEHITSTELVLVGHFYPDKSSGYIPSIKSINIQYST